MTAIPQPNNSTQLAVIRWRESVTDQGHRPHLGASQIGMPCDRRLWYVFRWAEREQFDGRMLRLFDHGKREEARVVEELRGIGCQVWADDGGAQFRVATHGGHFGGSMDGVVLGLPEASKAYHVVEIKTHGVKSFASLLKDGVRKSKPQHWAQMQTYMHLTGIDRALYYAVEKDTDTLYLERVEHDEAEAEKLQARALRIIQASEPPLRLSDDPAWYECKWCPFHSVCHGQAAPEVNCRTCVRSTPEMDGDSRWSCSKQGRDLTVDDQRVGCPSHLYIPPLLAKLGEPVDGTDDSVTYRAPDGRQFVNGPAPGFRSVEIRANPTICLEPVVQELKQRFHGAEVVR